MHTNKRTPDTEPDIRDDAFLRDVNADVRRARKRGDRVLMWMLAVIVPTVLILESTGARPRWISAILGLAVLATIVTPLTLVARYNRRIAEKHGLVCTTCGSYPSTHMVVSAAMAGRCARCASSLPFALGRNKETGGASSP